MIDLSHGLLDRGHQVEVVWSRPRSDAKFLRELDELVARGALATEIYVPRKPHPSDKRAIGTLVEAISRSQPDIVHGHSSKAGAIVRLASKSTGVRAVYTPHGFVTMDVGLPRWRRAIFQRIERWLDRYTSRLIAVSHFEAQHAKELGIREEIVRVVHNGVPDRRGAPLPSPRIGFVGRLCDAKAPLRFLGAVELLRKAGNSTPVTMIGDGPLTDACERFVRDKGLEGVEMLGNVDAIEHFPRFTVLAITSNNEAFPYVALEAQSFGIPVVGTDIGALREIVSPSVDGEICGLDEGAVMRALTRVLEDPSYINACRSRPHRFGLEEMVERTISVYRECAA